MIFWNHNYFLHYKKKELNLQWDNKLVYSNLGSFIRFLSLKICNWLTNRPVSTLGSSVSRLPSCKRFSSSVPSRNCLKHTNFQLNLSLKLYANKISAKLLYIKGDIWISQNSFIQKIKIQYFSPLKRKKHLINLTVLFINWHLYLIVYIIFRYYKEEWLVKY